METSEQKDVSTEICPCCPRQVKIALDHHFLFLSLSNEPVNFMYNWIVHLMNKKVRHKIPFRIGIEKMLWTVIIETKRKRSLASIQNLKLMFVLCGSNMKYNWSCFVCHFPFGQPKNNFKQPKVGFKVVQWTTWKFSQKSGLNWCIKRLILHIIGWIWQFSNKKRKFGTRPTSWITIPWYYNSDWGDHIFPEGYCAFWYILTLIAYCFY